MGSLQAASTMPPLLPLLLLLLPPAQCAPGDVPPLMQSLKQRLIWPENCVGGEYGGCQGDRCQPEFCCCSWQDSGCGLLTCPEGTVFSEYMWYCVECNIYNYPDPENVCVDPATIGC